MCALGLIVSLPDRLRRAPHEPQISSHPPITKDRTALKIEVGVYGTFDARTVGERRKAQHVNRTNANVLGERTF